MIELVDTLANSGRLAIGAGGITLIVAGRWLLRAQAVTSFLRMAGVFSILLGLLVAFGFVDIRVSELIDGVSTVIRALGGV